MQIATSTYVHLYLTVPEFLPVLSTPPHHLDAHLLLYAEVSENA